MKMTKLPHACLILEQDGSRIVIDPSGFFAFDKDFATPENVAAVVYTHNHFDHYDPKNLQRLIAKNSAMKIFASADTANSIARDLPDTKNVTTIRPVDKISLANFQLEFFGGRHAHILPGDDKGDNVGIVVNSRLVYPGDSFDFPARESLANDFVLALPVSGPWLKIGEAIMYLRDFAKNIAVPAKVFATHDGLNGANSGSMTANYFAPECEKLGAKWVDLQIGQSLEI